MSTSYITPDSGSGNSTISIDLGTNQTRAAISKTFVLEGSGGVSGSNQLVVTQEAAPLMHTASGATSKTASVYGSGETITFEGIANGRYIMFSSGTISSFSGFTFQENSSGSYVSKTPGDQWIEVSNFGNTYHYKIVCPVPVNWGSGATATIMISVADTQSDATSIDVTYTLSNAIKPSATTTANIYAVYKSPNSGGEQVNGRIGWYVDNSSDDDSYTISTSSSSAYTYAVMQTITGTVDNTIKFGVSASASGAVMQSPFTIYASNSEVGSSYITEGTFISNNNEVGTIANDSWNYDNLMYTIPFSTIWSQLYLSEGAEINLYVLLDAEVAHGPSVSGHGTLEYDDDNDEFGENIGIDASITGASTSRSYNITATLYIDPMTHSGQNNTFTLVNNGILYSMSNQTIAANAVFQIANTSAVSDYIKLTNNPTASDADILEAIYDTSGDVKIRVVVHDTSSYYVDTRVDLSIYRTHN